MTATSASVRFSAGGAATVECVRPADRPAATSSCCVYADTAPILTIQDAHVDITITEPRPGRGDR